MKQQLYNTVTLIADKMLYNCTYLNIYLIN